MISAARILILSGIVLTGCTTARDVAVTSFRVLDAPANYVRRKIDPSRETTLTTTTETSDVATPGRPLEVASPGAGPSQQRTTTNKRPPPQTSPRPTSRTTSVPPQPKATPAPTQPVQFPSAKPVPGRAGYVYSLDPKGGIVDVTGYKPGDKARDPYTQQIFIVP